ncbi:uncharacterized protein B0J16DRAFT_380951 [Fusarium flagelliforme]|uniref:uncharacterized protein n=1 Tax=Fusarium flagelliforme TaxID=2675880 RepID=UPI001E8E42AA|nr:uncharacterized protein B0J16DRAFT_380951 [Fusarium flagelliforme]KAH7193062.1 hypothetical protein B0J16DRAFT_380951 [Fusarium flagelliforme]
MDKASANSAAWRMKRTLEVLALPFALVTFGTVLSELSAMLFFKITGILGIAPMISAYHQPFRDTDINDLV